MRLLLVGAFSFPHSLGSPAYLREQARALRAAGAEVHLLTYGPPTSAPIAPGAEETGTESDGFEQTVVSAWARPASRRSGPSLGKPVADLALAVALRRLVVGEPARSGAPISASAIAPSDTSPGVCSYASSDASKTASSNARGDLRRASSRTLRGPGIGFDAILAHHAEATLAALHLLPRRRPPIVYCAHTLLEHELPEYLKPPMFFGFSERTQGAWPTRPSRSDDRMTHTSAQRGLARLGRVIDRGLARRAEAWIALTQSSDRVMTSESRGVGRWIAPPVGDLRSDPNRRDPAAIARRFELVPDRFFLYSGNLDPYQDLPLLERVAAAREGSANAFPLVVATHDDRAAAGASPPTGGLRIVRVRSAAEANALGAAARATIVPRRSIGGFPIKLLNALALGAPVVAFQAAEWGLVDGVDALVCDPARPEASLLAALERLEADAELARRLGAGARAAWRARHQPERVAADTLDLIAKLVD